MGIFRRRGPHRSPSVDAAASKPEFQAQTDERLGSIRVHDPRVFQASRRDFCRSWVESATRAAWVRKVSVDLATATALIEFEPGSTSVQDMAASFAASVLEALECSSEPADDLLENSPSSWVALIAFTSVRPLSVWEVTERRTRRLRLRHRGLQVSPDRLDRWLQDMAESGGPLSCRAGLSRGGLTISYDPALATEEQILESSEKSWAETFPQGPIRRNPYTPLATTPLRRASYLLKAAGSFVMTIVGLAIPGIPTFPFLVATSYYLARSSPALNTRLLHSPIFGAVLEEWNAFGGLSTSSKHKLIGLSAFLFAVSFLIAAAGAASFVAVLIIGSVSIYAIIRLPDAPPHALLPPTPPPILA